MSFKRSLTLKCFNPQILLTPNDRPSELTFTPYVFNPYGFLSFPLKVPQDAASAQIEMEIVDNVQGLRRW